jgi:hypothetical protein
MKAKQFVHGYLKSYQVLSSDSFFLIPFYLQVVQIYSVNGIKLLEA